jgi:hypothetical protein
MAGSKIRLAQEAALAAARTLAPEDRVGVIAFDDVSDWIAPFQGAERQGTLISRVRAMEAGAAAGDLAALKARSRVREAEALLDPAGLGGFLVAQRVV